MRILGRWCGVWLVLLASPSQPAWGESTDEQLWEAIQRGNRSEALEAITLGARVKNSRQPLLETALSTRTPEIAGLLLENAVALRSRRDGHADPMMIAINNECASLELIEQLYRAGASLETRDERGGLVQLALRAGRDDLARWLVGAHAPLDVPDVKGRTELMTVAQREVVDESASVELVRLLLKAGARPELRDSSGRSAADYAAERGDVAALRLLEPANPSARDLRALRQTGLNHCLATAIRFHAASRIRWTGPQPNQPTSQIDVIRKLLMNGADPQARVTSARGEVSMLELALGGESRPIPWGAGAEVIELLLKHGARWDDCGEKLPTILHDLAGYSELLAIALAHGLPAESRAAVEFEIRYPKKQRLEMSLLHAACSTGAVESVELLLRKNVDPNRCDSAGYTPLMRALQGGHEEVVSLLLKRGASTATGPNVPTLLDLAAAGGLIPRVREWDSTGKFRELTEAYPPQKCSKWAGRWGSGAGERHASLELFDSGMGRRERQTFAWCETEDGVRVRMVQRDPQMIALSRARELALVGPPEGPLFLGPRAESGSVALNDDSWALYRPGRPAPNLSQLQREALQRETEAKIQAQLAALRSGRTSALRLDGEGMPELPLSLLSETGWAQVGIYWMSLRELPAACAGWTKVESLTASNQLEPLTVAQGALDLPKLKRLEITNARILTLPLHFAVVPSIQELHVQNNRLRELPSGWGAAGRLTTVFLWNNRIRVLPSDIGAAPSLTTLNCSGNMLTDLPDSLAKAPLETLSLDDNRLAHVPEVIGRMERLTSLAMGRNELREIPAWLFALPKLQDVNLSENPLEKVPETRGSKTLKTLALRDCGLAQIPADPEWLPGSVEELDLSYNQLKQVPPWLEKRAFKRLSLQGNPMPDADARRISEQAEQLWRKTRK